MKFREIFSFELRYQARTFSTWLYFTITFLFSLWFCYIAEPTEDNVHVNAPSFLILLTVFVNVIWLLMSGAIAGHAAARDVQTHMHPLVYTAHVSKFQYLGGRFVAVFMINALIILTAPVGFILSYSFRDIDPSLLGPFQPEVYLTTYFYLALPLVFTATACQFTAALLERKTIYAYVASIFLFPIACPLIATTLAELLKNWDLAVLADPVGISSVDKIDAWTPFEKNTRMLELQGVFLWNRVLWVTIGIGMLAFTYIRFQFTHHTIKNRWRIFKKKSNSAGMEALSVRNDQPIRIPSFNRTFGFKTNLAQTWAIAKSSFSIIARNKIGFAIIGLIAAHFVLFISEYLKFRGVPEYPTTMNMLTLLTAPLSNLNTPLIIIPLFIMFYAGELVWTEREAGISKISDTVPISEWTILLGKFLGLTLTIMAWLSILLAGGILAQSLQGYTDFEIEVYLLALFGFQFIDYLLFALLVLVIHAVVNHKYLAHLVVLSGYGFIVFHSKVGIEHNLFVYTSDPGWSYSDMRGFGPYVKPWLWFKLYWVGWAILLSVVARLLWMRTVSQGFKARIELARKRFTRTTAITTVSALVMILSVGGFIFYNTNVLNEYITASEGMERQVDYEKRYRIYRNIAQPVLTKVKLHVELYPGERKADVAGIYTLANHTPVPIDSIHLTTSSLETTDVTFYRNFSTQLEDNKLSYRIYKLEKPLQPGDSLTVSFTVRYKPQGFPHKGIDVSVIENGTYFINNEWLPMVGYQTGNELRDSGRRKKYGLGPNPYPSLYDTTAYKPHAGQTLIALEAVIGTEGDQQAVTAGKQLRQWKENGRNYFAYAASSPIPNKYSFFSARYAVRSVKGLDSLNRDVGITVYHHPGHEENIERMVKSVQASLAYYTKKFGPYPYSHLTIMERSGYTGELNAEPATIDYGESFTLPNQTDNPWALDITYFAMAHEVAHQWWGAAQLLPASVEGAPVLSETLANYSALKVLEETYGQDQVDMLLTMWRYAYEVPRSRVTEPLLQATDPFMGYRKGPLALYALTQYAGKDQVNDALRQLIQKYGSGNPPLPTSLDLYRELKHVTPDSLHYLLQDYFEKNIYWQLSTEDATARQLDSTSWQVTLKLQAKKVIVDSTGSEIVVPMDDWIELAVYAPWEEGNPESGKVLYQQKHRIRSGQQSINVVVTGKPGRAGIDPNNLLIDLNTGNNIRNVKINGATVDEPD